MRLLASMLVLAVVISAEILARSPHLVSAGAPASNPRHVILVRGHPTRLTVSLYRWTEAAGQGHFALLKKGTSRDNAVVSQIVNVLNHVNAYSPGVHTCPALPGSRSVLQFGYGNGDTWTVYIDGCWGFSTHGVVGTALGDPPVYGSIDQLLDRVAR